jgi:hypothetical protein
MTSTQPQGRLGNIGEGEEYLQSVEGKTLNESLGLPKWKEKRTMAWGHTQGQASGE